MMKFAYLALGSNLGDRSRNLGRAIEKLAAPDLHIIRESSVYETEPHGLRDQPWFLNQVIEIATTLFPRQLLSRVKRLEREMGRVPTVRNGPRLIDIDILLYADATVRAADLEIPHPRLAERRFVLEPLAELVPELRHPRTSRTVSEMLADVRNQAIRRAK
jgi:2-amino-4-hydroxy-6-hydroxymethyldihydropteridine diphosphokinase